MNLVRITFMHAVVLAIFVVVVIGPAPAVAARVARTAIVQVDRLNLRAEATVRSRALAVLGRDTRVAVMDVQGKWLKVRYKDKTGFLRNNTRYVTLVAAEMPAPQARQSMTRMGEKARTLKNKIKTSEAAVVTYTRKEAEVIRSLDDVERALDRARRRVAASRLELDRIDKALAENQQALDKLEKQIAAAEDYAAGRLVALYKLGWLGKLNILASADSMLDMLQRERALSRILDQDEQHLEILERDYNRLEALQAEQKKKRAAKQALEAEYRVRAAAMLAEKQRKASVLDEIRSKKSLELAAIEGFREDAKNLDRAIYQLGRALDGGLKKEVAKNKAPVGTVPQSFTARKGLLKLPVKGKIKNGFGAYRNKKFKTMNFRSGIDIQADRGEPVYAVFPGRVLYSSWFKGYGNMVIIDHGDHYYTVYAHVEEIFKKKGEAVEGNEVIATVGDTGSMEGPELYFEVRYHGKPLDPEKWIKKG